MSKQLNKEQKRQRRKAYIKRKRGAIKAAKAAPAAATAA